MTDHTDEPDRVVDPFQLRRPPTLLERIADLLPVNRGQLRQLWNHVLDHESLVTDKLIEMEERMTSTEQAAYARLGELVGLVKAEFASLRQQVDQAVADKDAAVAAGVASALGEETAADVERLNGLIAELEAVVPVPVPEVPVPDPGQPAELPTDSGVETPTEPTPGEPSE